MTSVLLAYFGPEAMMPLTSIVASALGLFLMFGQGIIRYCRRLLKGRRRESGGSAAIAKPHFRVEGGQIEAEGGYAGAGGAQDGAGALVRRDEQ